MYSELNDTVVEAQLRIRQNPPLLPKEDAVERYMRSSNRLLILVFTILKSHTAKNLFAP